MNRRLTVDDPLAEQEVTIVITLAAGEQARDERMALMSVGVTGQPPVTRIGPFGQVTALIDEAWTAFGVQAQVAAAKSAKATEPTTIPAGETTDTPARRADAASVVEAAVPSAQEATPQPHVPASKPQPDLSFLF
ncbi:MAG: hypothetical protein IT327_23830 [Anaerolineae bacterium]|nr:hypothetical protein [Anaerolineae bacterium]